MMTLENLKQAYLYKANYCLVKNTPVCLYELTVEFSETINSKEFSSFPTRDRQRTINEFKTQLTNINETLGYKKAS